MSKIDTEDVRLVPPAVDALPVNIAILDEKGVIQWTNKAWRDFGRRNDIALRPETMGINYLDITAAADDDHSQQAYTGLKAVLRGETDEFELEYPCHSAEEKRWFTMRAAAFSSLDDRYAIVAHIDITQRVMSERRSELFERVVETAGHVVFITDRNGTITYVNPAFEEVTGYTATEAIGETPRLLKSGEHERAFYDDMWETICAGEQWKGTIVNRRKSGALYYAHASIDPVTTDTGEIRQFVTVQSEITEIKELQEQLQKQDTVLRHNLRTQLNVILLNAESIADELPDESDHVTAIIDATETLLETTEKTRELRQFLERTMEPAPVNVAAVVRDVCEAQREQFPAAEITLTAPAAATALSVDSLDRALAELVENSVTHSDQQTPQVSIDVTERDDSVVVAVADDGPGIPPIEYLSFEDDDQQQLAHRSGIGLDLAYWITRRSGGHLSIEERDPRGAVVRVHLPRPDEDTP